VDKSELEQFLEGYQAMETRMASLPSQMKKISHNASMVQEEHMSYLIKHDHKFADNVS
jgi:hypothetical protein